jgi:acyl-homoserine-lactone acylase
LSDPSGVQIDRTADGVAHVVAQDWAGACFGQAFALAQDRLPTLLDQVLKVRGERARWFGAGPGGANVASDAFYRWLRRREPHAEREPEVEAALDGYAAGVNRYLEEAARLDGRAGLMAGAVGRVERADLDGIARDLSILKGSRTLVAEIAAAEPPARGLGLSNAWAVGRDRSATGNALLLGNPHFPWTGELRFWECHLTVPGLVDVYGGAFTGVPGIAAGFNRRVAWSFTRSANRTMTFYRLTLAPGDAAAYVYGEELRELVPAAVEVDVRQEDGTTARVERTLWLSHHGPVIRASGETAIAVRDAGLEAPGFVSLWLALDRAGSVGDVTDAVGRFGTNGATIVAADAEGSVWFGDGSWTPSLTDAALGRWLEERRSGETAEFDARGDVLLDGSDPGNEWTERPGAPAPGLLPFDAQPSITGTGVVLNCNDSYWLADPDRPLAGFSPLQGETGVPQGARTRLSTLMLRADDPLGLRGGRPGLTLDDLMQLVLCNVSLHAVQDRETVVLAAREADGTAARVLAAWDGRFDLRSRGALLWREVVRALARRMDGRPRPAFDPGRPIETPPGLVDPVADAAIVVEAVADAVLALERLGIPLDAPLGDHQYDGRVGGGAPVHGGLDGDGVVNVNADYTGMDSTLEPHDSGPRRGYPVTFGAGFLHAVELTPEGPIAMGILVYGQTDDPADPAWSSQVELLARKEWRPLRFEPDEVAAGRIGSRTISF